MEGGIETHSHRGDGQFYTFTVFRHDVPVCEPTKAGVVLQSKNEQHMLRKLVYFEFGHPANVAHGSSGQIWSCWFHADLDSALEAVLLVDVQVICIVGMSVREVFEKRTLSLTVFFCVLA